MLNSKPLFHLVPLTTVLPLLPINSRIAEDLLECDRRNAIHVQIFDGDTNLEFLDLDFSGDADSDEPQPSLIIVKGSLKVADSIFSRDTNGAVALLVDGDLCCRCIVGGGQPIHITKSLVADAFVWGDGSYGSLYVGGNLTTGVQLSTDGYKIEVLGKSEFLTQICDAKTEAERFDQLFHLQSLFDDRFFLYGRRDCEFESLFDRNAFVDALRTQAIAGKREDSLYSLESLRVELSHQTTLLEIDQQITVDRLLRLSNGPYAAFFRSDPSFNYSQSDWSGDLGIMFGSPIGTSSDVHSFSVILQQSEQLQASGEPDFCYYVYELPESRSDKDIVKVYFQPRQIDDDGNDVLTIYPIARFPNLISKSLKYFLLAEKVILAKNRDLLQKISSRPPDFILTCLTVNGDNLAVKTFVETLMQEKYGASNPSLSAFSFDADFSSDEPDDRMMRAFKASMDLKDPSMMESDWQAVKNHKSVAYFVSDRLPPEKKAKVAMLALDLVGELAASGLVAGIKCDSSGIAHGLKRWVELSHAAALAGKENRKTDLLGAVFRAWVRRPLEGFEHYYSCGMHLLGHRDFVVRFEEVEEEENMEFAAAEIMEQAFFLLMSQSRESDKLLLANPTVRISHYDVDHPYFTPYGYYEIHSK